jgi:signal transduction histidine kinase
LVEDNPIETRLLINLFDRFGAGEFKVQAVTRLRDAIQVLQSTDIDVVLLDLTLEDASGLETLQRLRHSETEAPIVVLTGLDDEGQAVEALKNGAQDYLVKARLNRHMLFRAMRYAIERKRAELDRRVLEQRLLEGQKLEAIGTLARGVAHNFNNMLTAILGRSELILENPDAPVSQHVAAIKRSAERAALLTRQLLTFSRTQNHGLQPMNLNDAIAEMRLLLESILANDIVLEFKLAAESQQIDGDRQQLGQMLMNLVINARAAMPDGGLCAIETVNDDEHILLTIRDTGCGMSSETLAHMFEPFFSTKGMAIAPGLGLSAVYGIVQQHGGSIRVASKLGGGTTFYIHLPLFSRSRANKTAPVRSLQL